jgi:hypothetical protein
MDALRGTLSGRKVTPRVRTRTPPRITEHKPPRPLEPCPTARPPSLSSRPSSAGPSSPTARSGESSPAAGGGAGSGASTPKRLSKPDLSVGAAAAGAGGAAPSGSPAAPVMGYLTKKGEFANMFTGASWKRRWMVLEGGELTYYTDQLAYERSEKPLKGHRIPVAALRVVLDAEGADITLAPLVGEDGMPVGAGGGGGGEASRKWFFLADSKADMVKWLAGLTAHGARAPLNTTSSRWLK